MIEELILVTVLILLNPDLGAKESEFSNFIGTKLAGTLSGELDVDNSPYIIEDDIIIPSGSELKINPGKL